MPLINCKEKLKFKWTKNCLLAATGGYNTNANPNNIIFIIKDCLGKKNSLNVLTTTFHQRKTFRTYPGQSKKYFLCSFDKLFTY